jgi:hypothetical protein
VRTRAVLVDLSRTPCVADAPGCSPGGFLLRCTHLSPRLAAPMPHAERPETLRDERERVLQEHQPVGDHHLRGDGGHVLALAAQADDGPVPGPHREADDRDASTPLPRSLGSAARHLHGLPAVRTRLPHRVHCGRDRQEPRVEAARDDALRHRHRQMHVLRPVRRSLQVRVIRRTAPHARVRRGDRRLVVADLPLRPGRAGAARQDAQGQDRDPGRRLRPLRARSARAMRDNPALFARLRAEAKAEAAGAAPPAAASS